MAKNKIFFGKMKCSSVIRLTQKVRKQQMWMAVESLWRKKVNIYLKTRLFTKLSTLSTSLGRKSVRLKTARKVVRILQGVVHRKNVDNFLQNYVRIKKEMGSPRRI